MRVPAVFEAALAGLRRQFEKFDVAAAEVLEASTDASTPEHVEVSDAARQAASRDNALTSGIEKPLVDLRVAKYLAVANMEVLKTGEEVSRELANVVRPGGR